MPKITLSLVSSHETQWLAGLDREEKKKNHPILMRGTLQQKWLPRRH